MTSVGLVLIVIGAVIWFFARGELESFGKILAVSGLILVALDLILDLGDGEEIGTVQGWGENGIRGGK